MVVVLCNLKPRKMGTGWESKGMIMCAETENKSAVELLAPPEGSQPGDLVSFVGYPREPLEVLPAKKNPFFDLVADRLVIDGEMQACYKNAEE